MFFGQYRHALDDKGRFRMPAKLKETLSAEFIVTKGTNSCLFVFPKNYFQKEFLEKLSNVPTFSEAQKPVRLLLSSSFHAQEDSQGRFLIPQNLKDFAGIVKNMVIVGVGNRIEIWSAENWEGYAGDESDYNNIVKTLENFNI